jgi:hypothetical protein
MTSLRKVGLDLAPRDRVRLGNFLQLVHPVLDADPDSKAKFGLNVEAGSIVIESPAGNVPLSASATGA